MSKSVVHVSDVNGRPEYKGERPAEDYSRFEDAMRIVLTRKMKRSVKGITDTAKRTPTGAA